uniref:Protein kinase domain-containing protein n=1 Tax=Arcella intermedia TaxID=1963864 RepID=A0A6B2KXB9_9EUKA
MLDPSPNISPLTKEIEGRVSDANIKSSFELMEALLKEHANESNVPILNFNDLMRIGALCHLTNSAEIKACVRTLHRSGSIIFYEGIKELQEVVILDPKWLFEVMATFFTANDSFLKDGVVDPKNLKHIWTSYPEEIYPKLVLLLESFDLIISIEQNLNTLLKVIKTSQETDVTPPISLCSLSSTDNPFSKTSAILVPSFLPKNRPNKLIEKIWDNQPEGMPQISRIFRFTFLPNGIFQRFVSRLLHLHTDVLLTTLWSNGAIVSLDSIINVFVQQVTDSSDGIGLEENDIFIEVRSKDKHYMRDIFHELCSELIRIASSWESISWTRHVVFPQMTGEVKKINVETVVDQLEINGGLEGYDGISISNIVPEIMVSNYQGPRIDLKNIKLGKELGEGGFARVKEGISAKNEVYAVKIMNFDASSKKNTSRENDDALSSFRKEVMLQSKLKHPNILSLLAIGVNPHCMYFELCKLGNLHDYKNNLLLPLQWKVKLKIALDIAQAMDYLHSQEPPIAHLDLKSPNVLLQTDPQSQFQIISKVSDFGTALAVRGPIRIRYVENPTWLAPEIIQGQGYREDVDVYAFGLILWEIITRCELFADEDHASTIQDKIISGDRPRIPKECPVELRNLITACWSSDPNSRPKWKQIILTINELFLTEDKEDIVFSREKQSKSTLAVIPDRTITIEETTHNDSPETEEDKIRSSSRFKRILRGSFLEKSGKEPLAMRNCFEDLYNDKNAFNSFKEYLKSGGGDFSTDCLDYHKLVHKYKKTGSSKYSQKITAFLMKEDTVVSLKWSGGKKIFNEHTNTMNLVGVNLEELFIEISSTFEKELEQRILNWKKTDMRKKSVVKKKDIQIISSEPASPLVQKWTMDGSKRKLAASTRNFFSMRTKPMDSDEMKTRQEFEEYCIQNGLNHNFHCYKMITDSSSSSVSTLTQIHFQFLAPSLLILPPNAVIEKIQLLYSQGLTEEKEQEARSVLQELKSLLLEDSIKKGTKERNIT